MIDDGALCALAGCGSADACNPPLVTPFSLPFRKVGVGHATPTYPVEVLWKAGSPGFEGFCAIEKNNDVIVVS